MIVILNASKVRWCLVSRARTVRDQNESGNSARRSLVDKMLGHRIATRLPGGFELLPFRTIELPG